MFEARVQVEMMRSRRSFYSSEFNSIENGKQAEADRIIEKAEFIIKEIALENMVKLDVSKELQEFTFINLNNNSKGLPQIGKEEEEGTIEISFQSHAIFSVLKQCSDLQFKTLILSKLNGSEPGTDESIILNDVLDLIEESPDLLIEILRGGHVRIDDSGHYYSKWRSLPSSHKRISSHPHIKQSDQYGLMGPWTHETLFGIVKEGDKVKTFFQLENTPWAPGIKHRLGHAKDAVKYALTKKNIGPYGESPHLDSNPIRLTMRTVSSEMTT